MVRKSIGLLLNKRLQEPTRFIQVLAGPRQVGKTTLVRQVMTSVSANAHYASADAPTLKGRELIMQQWELGRLNSRRGEALLILDEIQKVPDCSEIVKRLWDEDTHANLALKVVLLGSSPLLIQSGWTESLAGRFEVIPVPHWSFPEMQEAFGWDVEQFIYYGAYPGAAPLISDPERWQRYVMESLIETSISRDILLMSRVDKPALLRRLFQLACDYSGQILSYQKMTGQLSDAGNTVTLAHYLQLLQGAGMAAGLSKFAGGKIRQRGSSPKLQVLNTALMSASSGLGFAETRRESERWGRLVESAVGAHLMGSTLGSAIEVTYWRERNQEVDFVLQRGTSLVAIEVKSAARRGKMEGMEAFRREFAPLRTLLVGADGISLEEFLSTPASSWLEK